MNPSRTLPTVLLAAGLMTGILHAADAGVANTAKPDGRAHVFSFGGEKGEQFLLDGKPLQIRSGEMHPQRIPKEYWRHRVRMAKALGLNTIAFYVMWNDLEREDGTFDFTTGNRDIAGFLRICHEEGMWVLFRPGPYVCAEWDFGGIPSKLLRHADLKIRTTQDRRFLDAQERYLKAVAAVAAPYRVGKGGPILMTQLENEYGSYQRKDRAYMLWLRDFWTGQGFAPFYTSDGAGDHFLKGVVLPGVAVGLDPGENEGHWNVARKNNPGVPVFSSETYPGWLRHWGEGNWSATNKKGVVEWYMKEGKSFNLFVIHGGTNFGFTAGANHGGTGYQPDLTSYDYGSPINEQGAATKEYGELRTVITSFLPESARPGEPPAAIPAMTLPDFTPVRHAGLWDNLPAPVSVEKPVCFEAWGQNQGLAIYRTTVPAGAAGKLTYANLHDYGQVYLDGVRIATVNRVKAKPAPVELPAREKPAVLEVLVEGMGHINFNIAMESDRKGLFGEVKIDGKELTNWQIHRLPQKDAAIVGAPAAASASKRPGAHFRAKVTIAGTPADTFLDMSKYEKGTVWVNGHNLGRYWSIGPQYRLYCPAPWLRTGENTIDIVDLEMTEPRPVRGCVERNQETNNKATRNANNEW